MKQFFRTNQRRLEQFLWAHGIDWVNQTKDEDGMTVWVYLETDEVRRVVDEFRQGIAKRKERRI